MIARTPTRITMRELSPVWKPAGARLGKKPLAPVQKANEETKKPDVAQAGPALPAELPNILEFERIVSLVETANRRTRDGKHEKAAVTLAAAAQLCENPEHAGFLYEQAVIARKLAADSTKDPARKERLAAAAEANEKQARRQFDKHKKMAETEPANLEA